MSTQIKYVGEESYHSYDLGNGSRPIDLAAGDSTQVSDEKATQLAEDFPHLFEIGGKKAAAAPAPPAPPEVVDDPAAELALLKPAELKAVADPFGIKSNFRKKKDVIADILAAREAAKDQAQ